MAISRSENMARIRSRNTTPELRLRKALWAAGIRYRVDYKTPAGRADVAFITKKIAVFVDGCFWHGCPRHYVSPRSSVDFWSAKLTENVERDRRQTLALEAAGWQVIRVWEHEVFESADTVIAAVVAALDGRGRGASRREVVRRVEEVTPDPCIETRYYELLRDPSTTRSETGPRITKKWKRPK